MRYTACKKVLLIGIYAGMEAADPSASRSRGQILWWAAWPIDKALPQPVGKIAEVPFVVNL
jgi:hypothetical protein